MSSNNRTYQLTLSSGFFTGVAVGLTTIGAVSTIIHLTRSYNNVSYALTKLSKSNKTAAGGAAATAGSGQMVAASGSQNVSNEAERAPERDAFWFVENMSADLGMRMTLKRVMFESRSMFQLVQVLETNQFGKTLVMDGQTQSAQSDEHIYHESLVHPAMLLHPNPKRVYIGGGGEFATAREVLRHSSVEKCVMVDIDKVACDICREQLPEWNNGAYEDPRFEVHYTDAKAWLEDREQEKFDVIILDICDPIEAGPGYKLYTQEFYNFLKTRLNENGIVVTQSGPGAVYNVKSECFTVINNTLRSSYNCVIPYVVDIPSFGCPWGFNFAIENKDTKASAKAAQDLVLEIMNKPVAEIDQMIKERITGENHFLDGVSFKGLLGIPKSIRNECEAEDRVMTIDNPVFMYAS